MLGLLMRQYEPSLIPSIALLELDQRTALPQTLDLTHFYEEDKYYLRFPEKWDSGNASVVDRRLLIED